MDSAYCFHGNCTDMEALSWSNAYYRNRAAIIVNRKWCEVHVFKLYVFISNGDYITCASVISYVYLAQSLALRAILWILDV